MSNFHSTTSMAVKEAVSTLKQKLSSRFDFLPGMPEYFYAFNKGLSEQFKQYYAKVSQEHKQKPWLSLAYSYDSIEKSTIQPRKGLVHYRPVTDLLKRQMTIQYVNLPVLFSAVTNDSKLLNALSSFLFTHICSSFTCKYLDLLWPTWLPDRTYPLGWYIRPSISNGKLYKCSKAGVTSKIEPTWKTTIGEINTDNEAQWTCVEPDRLTVRAGDFVKNNTVIQNPMESGVLYQIDFGLTLHFTELDDNNKTLGVITEIECELLDIYNSQVLNSMAIPD